MHCNVPTLLYALYQHCNVPTLLYARDKLGGRLGICVH
jgi:hypothetical protein